MNPIRLEEGWRVVETVFDSDNNRKFEGLFTLGSGYLHIRGSLEEHIADALQDVTYTRMPANVTSEEFVDFKARWGTFVPGLYGHHRLLNSELINLPFFALLVPVVDGKRLDMTTSKYSDYRRCLDMRTATLSRSLLWHTDNGTVAVSFQRFVSAARPGLCVQRLVLEPSTACTIAVESAIDSNVRTNGYNHFRESQCSPVGATRLECQIETDTGDRVQMLSEISGKGSRALRNLDDGYISHTLTHSASGSERLEFLKFTVVGTSQDTPSRDLTAELNDAIAVGYKDLFSEHALEWQRRWDGCDIVVEGDEESQLALRTSLYHLLRSHPRDERVAIDAKGYAGEGYFGRFFWDTEVYLVPFFLYTEPERAKQLMEFRVRTLEAAKQNAASYGYPGARFAWESDRSGIESCAVWQYRDHEIHVTADIAYAFSHIAAATDDSDYLSGGRARVLVESARYWAARIDMLDGQPALLGVMGPDEYGPITHNNAYTNKVVKYALALAAEVGAEAGASPEEIRQFKLLSETLPILRRADGLILQNEGFERLAEPNFDLRWKNRSKTYASQVSQERLYRSKNLKQADVLMMMFMFGKDFDDAEVRQAWDYYLPYTTHDSSLSAGIHSILACRLGMTDHAWELWKESCTVDIDFTRSGPAEGIHIAGAAANWMNIVFGFGGIRPALESPIFTIAPTLPKQLSKISFPFTWHGTKIAVSIDESEVRLVHREGPEMEVELYGKRMQLRSGQEIVHPR
jgi:kojibiose phosphorylase